MAAEQTTGQSNGAAGKPSREQLIAELDSAAVTDEPAADEAPAEAPTEPKGPADEAPIDDEAPDEKIAEEPVEEPVDVAKDPDLAKRLAIVAKHEKRAKDAVAKERTAVEQERLAVRRERDSIDREIQSVRSEIEAFNQAKARAKYDPKSVLLSLGLSEEDLGPAARQLWAHTKENLTDPKNREAAERMMRERESLDRISKLEKEIEERKQAETTREQQTRIAHKVESYLDGIGKAAKADEHPLAMRLIEKAPDAARTRFAAIAHELSLRDDGDLPDAVDVLAEYEKRRRAELEIDGIDWAIKPKAKPRTEAQPTTLGNDVGTRTASTATNGAPRKSHEQKKAELEAELRAMDLRGR